MIGPEPKDDKRITILNRTVEWNSEGIKYEADSRHVQIVLDALDLKGKESKGVITPHAEPEINETPLSPEQETMCR